MATSPASPAFYRLEGDRVRFRPHAGQAKALRSPKRFVLILAGSQSGKTVIGPLWLLNEIKLRGEGDYLCVAPSYPLMQRKMLPEFLRLFSTHLQLGTYRHTDRTFEFHGEETRVLFGHAEDPEAAESATA